MQNEIILCLAQIGLVFLLGLIAASLSRPGFRLNWLIISLLLYVLYEAFLTRGFYSFPPWPATAQWNWLGKSLSLVAMLLIAALPGFGYRRCGLTLGQSQHWRSALIVTLLLSATFFFLAIRSADGADDWETIAFQWTMPGLDEEVFYRGVVLLALNEAFRSRWNVLGAPIGWGGILSCVLFGLGHALDYDDMGFSFDNVSFAVTGGPAFILVWLRERSGSLLLPIIGHNVANGAFTLF